MNVGLILHHLNRIILHVSIRKQVICNYSLYELNLNSFIKTASFIQIVNIKAFIKKKKPNRTEVFCCTEPNRRIGEPSHP